MCLGNSEDALASKAIDRELLKTKEEESRHVKLLLLGAGESGKSTIAKQIKIIHLQGFNEQELKSFKSIIFGNILSSMKTLVEAVEHLQIRSMKEENKVRAKQVLQEEDFNETIAKEIQILWRDPGIRESFNRSSEFQLNDSAEYYFEAIDRIAQPTWVPTVQDVLQSRAKTTGIIETEFTFNRIRFSLVDVGGQRSERRKWMHCFQDVTAVIFCAALSEYDLKLYEDETTNRMHEALKLFKDICNTKWFVETAIVLFLNKKDLFERKIKRVPLTVCFEEYKGPQDSEAASQYITDQFLAQNDNPKKLIYVHLTTATDTKNITVVIGVVQDIILNKILGNIVL